LNRPGLNNPAIVIFGAAVRPDGTPSTALRWRTEAAVALGRRLDAPIYIPTGGLGINPPTEAEVMARLLHAMGVAPEQIVMEPTARNTIGSVRAVRGLLCGMGHRGRVYAATSAYHLPRCVMLLRLAGLRAHAAPPPPWPAARAWRRRWYWRLREAAALPVDAALIVWQRATGSL
jgi:uncharacterized SAM-binding protein YcdF (DUF218 family)